MSLLIKIVGCFDSLTLQENSSNILFRSDFKQIEKLTDGIVMTSTANPNTMNIYDKYYRIGGKRGRKRQFFPIQSFSRSCWVSDPHSIHGKCITGIYLTFLSAVYPASRTIFQGERDMCFSARAFLQDRGS